MSENGREHLAVIRNPTAGGARGARFAATIVALRQAGCRVDIHESTSAEDVRRLAAALSEGPQEALLVGGGDGTINDAVNGMVPGSSMPLGIIPMGTANVLAWEIGLAKMRPPQLAEVLRCGVPHAIHLGRLVTENGPGANDGRLFSLMAGAGFDAAVVKGVNLGLKRRVGKLAYIWEAIRQIFINDFPTFDLEIDGKAYEAASIVVAKAAHYGGDYVITDRADLRVPSFQVCLFRRRGGLSVLRYALALERGTLTHLPDFEVIEGHEIVIRPAAGAPLQLDGDPAGVVPARIVLAAERLNLIYPA
ncbi:MAG TPA: diacylglycerol kinase family protein [Kiloniellaceae bacterium]|nr:diacylglycerol kinase family protein [Kiloniellaceae bacterium]